MKIVIFQETGKKAGQWEVFEPYLMNEYDESGKIQILPVKEGEKLIIKATQK